MCSCFYQADAPSKTAMRPYKRLSAQEVCYQRMQMAQQQAAQLSASVKAASQSSSASFSGERKRIAHRPNPQMTSSKTSMSASATLYCFCFYFYVSPDKLSRCNGLKLSSLIGRNWTISTVYVESLMLLCVCVCLGPADVKPAASRVLSPSQTHQTVKAQTTAGILSKTMSTVTQRRVAHTPTMKVFTGHKIHKISCCWCFSQYLFSFLCLHIAA